MSEREEELRSRLIRNFETADKGREVREPLYDTLCARLATGTAARKLGISVDILAPGKVACPYHFHHAQEEAFVIFEGHGTLRVAGERLALRPGDVVFVPPGPDYPHQILNTSDAPLKYLSISTCEVPEIVEYPDSHKLLIRTATRSPRDVPQAGSRLFRGGDPLDYWDGEP